jgi:hypothetical protein
MQRPEGSLGGLAIAGAIPRLSPTGNKRLRNRIRRAAQECRLLALSLPGRVRLLDRPAPAKRRQRQ